MAKIFTINIDKLSTMNERRLEKEDVLHNHLEKFPEIIAEALDTDNPRKFIVLNREAGVVGFSMDLLLLDQNYILTVVEAKRAESTDLRRKIIGQGIEYAANLVIVWKTKKILEQAKDYWNGKGKKLLDEINTTFEPEEPIEDDNILLQKVQEGLDNLQIIFAADGPFPNELKTAIEFLNKNFKTIKVYGLEVRYFGEEKGQHIITPLIVGRTTEAEIGKSTTKQWTEEMFLSELKKICGDDTDKIRVAEDLLNFSKDEGSKNPFEKGPSVSGNFNFYVKEGTKDYALFYVNALGNIYFYGLQNKILFTKELINIGFEILPEKKESLLSLGILEDPEKLKNFKNIIRTYVKSKSEN